MIFHANNAVNKVRKVVIFCLALCFLLLSNCASFQAYLASVTDYGDASAARTRRQRAVEDVTVAYEMPEYREAAAPVVAPIAAAAVHPSVYEVEAEVVDAEREINDGFVRLILNERNGTFALMYHFGEDPTRYTPLFNIRDPRTSFLTISYNGSIHRLGRSNAFSTRIERHNGDPALVFESASLRVTQVFTPIRTTNSKNANGVMMSISIENISEEYAMVGLRFLLDTELGNRRGPHFITRNEEITNEFLLQRGSDDGYWISPGNLVSLMGTIEPPAGFQTNNLNPILPDFVYFANWQRLNEANWKPRYIERRSFTNFPFSIRDSAVAYFWEPDMLYSGSIFDAVIFLTTEDILWHYGQEASVAAETSRVPVPSRPSALTGEIRADTSHLTEEDERILVRVQELLDQFIAGLIVLTEYELEEIEIIIERHR